MFELSWRPDDDEDTLLGLPNSGPDAVENMFMGLKVIGPRSWGSDLSEFFGS